MSKKEVEVVSAKSEVTVQTPFGEKSATIMAPYSWVEETALEQVRELLKLKELKNAKLVFQPDIHAGAGCTIGTTIKFNSKDNIKINPEWIGNDIHCGLTTVKIAKVENINLDFDKLDELAKTLHEPAKWDRRFNTMDFSTNLWKRIGRVSGGNHFLEIGEMDGYYWITVHNGSLSLGQDVYKRYTDLAKNKKTDTNGIIKYLKSQGKQTHINPVIQLIRELDRESSDSTLSGVDLREYLTEVNECKRYAFSNRVMVILRVLEVILDKKFREWYIDDNKLLIAKQYPQHSRENKLAYGFEFIDSPHNYIKTKRNGEVVVYKGATSAEHGEDVLIPVNMKDGIIVGKGKGNSEWNESAPHGAGRQMSRTQAKQNIDVDTYKRQTEGVRSISINENTLDEAPDAYKPMDYIWSQVQGETIDITGVIKPIYNFKVADEMPYWMKKKFKKNEGAEEGEHY